MVFYRFRPKGAVMDLLMWMEATSLSTWVRESVSWFAYPTILALHGVGLAWVVGPNVMIDLRILGFAPGLSLAELTRFRWVMVLGFWVNALTGAVLMMAYATEMFPNPAIWMKLVFIAVAILTLRTLLVRVLPAPENQHQVSSAGKRLALVSMVCWTGAIIAGRMTAYIHLIFD
jgi:hypothetical protein